MPDKRENSQLPQPLGSVKIAQRQNNKPKLESEKLCRIELSKEAINFSPAHFTIFKNRERSPWSQLSGNWGVLAPIDENGLVFDYVVQESFETAIR